MVASPLRLRHHGGRTDFSAVRRACGIVLGMALLTHLPTAEATRLGAAYGLDIASVEPQSGSVNSNFRLEAGDGSRFFLRIYEEQGFDGARSEL
ncbi:MAG TPA: hypothetical protein VGJ84_05820, partial [Polyangiaceae bacterium]